MRLTGRLLSAAQSSWVFVEKCLGNTRWNGQFASKMYLIWFRNNILRLHMSFDWKSPTNGHSQ